MALDPTSLDLTLLFRDPSMFESRDSFRSAGFQVIAPAKDSEVMVASHPALPGYLFKKYGNSISASAQRENYAARVEGARRLRALVASRSLSRVVVPGKWIRELPPSFGSQVLVVDRLSILDADRSKTAFASIDDATLRELCAVLFEIRGLDSNAKNIAFTTDGKIAFVDTENWARKKKGGYLRRIREYLPKDRRKFAEKIFDELEDLR